MAHYDRKRWRTITATVNALADSSGNSNDETDLALVETSDPIDIVSTEDVLSSTDFECDSESSDETEDQLSSSDLDLNFGILDEPICISEGNERDMPSLSKELASWATTNQCRREPLNELLEILRRHGHDSLPKDARTLLQTPRQVSTINKCSGQYIYFGIAIGILNVLSNNPKFCSENTEIQLIVNIDGLPLFKSSNIQMWPILSSFGGLGVFIVALFCGPSKPDNVGEYLKDFIEELINLKQIGIAFLGKNFNVNVKCFSCDAPARAFLKCVVSHSGYNSCERCTIKGSWNGRVVFTSHEKHPGRVEETFNNLGYKEHQKHQTPLLDAGINCITAFTLDYMHLVCLGVVKRILHFLKDGPKECKLSFRHISEISQNLINLKGEMPKEFARQPRSLVELGRWKATEFRQFLLYTGPLVLKDVVTGAMYRHFMALSVAISILLSTDSEVREYYLNYARKLLEYFVENSTHIYGETFNVYNVHGLMHLHEDVQNHDSSLNEISCFQFENHMQVLKKLVRNAQNPVAQVAKRQQELENTMSRSKSKKLFTTISTKSKDNCFLLRDGKFAFVREIRVNEMLVCDVISSNRLDNLYNAPTESKKFNVGWIPNLDVCRHIKKRLVEKTELRCKVVSLPHRSGRALFPMLHDIERL